MSNKLLRFLIILIVSGEFTIVECTKLKSVDYSLHTKNVGDMGYSIQYQNFMWRFTNATRKNKKGVEQTECLWQATLQNISTDTVSLQIAFRLFDIEGNVTEEIQYDAQKVSYPDTIARYFSLIPNKKRTIRGSFWVDKENALKTVDGDFYVVTTVTDTTRKDSLKIIPVDTTKIIKDTTKI